MSKFFYTLCMAWAILLVPMTGHGATQPRDPRGLLGDTCDPYNGGLISGIFRKKHVQESNKTWNLSRAFLNGVGSVSKTFTSSWSGKMTCTYGLTDNIYFFSALNGAPFYVVFNDNETALTYWIKFTVTVESSKKGVSGIGGTHSLSGYQGTYTITANLLTQKPSDITSANSKTVSSGVANLVPVVASGHGGASSSTGGIFNRTTYGQKALNYMINDTASSGWDTDDFLAFETLSITYAPNQTTCEVTHDVTITLPPASYARLVSNGIAPGRLFEVPIECGSQTSVTTSTRNIMAWLSSHDLVDDNGSTGTIMSNNESSAEGVGIILSDVMGRTLTLSNGYSRGAGTTELFSISKGEKLESDYNIYLKASYKTFDEKNLVPGTIVATAQVMFSYD